jgi:hypothetical protein
MIIPARMAAVVVLGTKLTEAKKKDLVALLRALDRGRAATLGGREPDLDGWGWTI